MAQVGLRVEMLGGFQVIAAGTSFSRFRTRQTASLFAYLALHRGKRLPREVLAEMFWPDATNLEKARASLAVAVSSLRSQLETEHNGQVLLVDSRSLGVRAEVVTTDVLEFESALDSLSTVNSLEAIEGLRQALTLFRGTFLPGFYDNWVLSEQARLRDRFIGAVRRLGTHFEEEGDIDEAIYWRRLELSHFPEDAGALEHLIQLLSEEERLEEAAQAYHEAARRWKDEGLGALPDSVGRCAHEALALYPTPNPKKKPHRATIGGGLPEPPVVPPVSEPTRASAPVSVSALPLELTRFVGREDELAQLKALLKRHDTRLVTVIGPGGMGKTRLALELAQQLQQGGGGAYFVSLQTARHGQDFLQALASSLQIRLPSGPASDPLETIAAFFNHQQEQVLVLDNMEQLLETDAMECLRSLLQRATSLRCLVTSQTRLAVPGERLFPLPPLPTPALESLNSEAEDPAVFEARWPSVALFVDRARESMPDFHLHARNLEIVARIVHLLEGIPLALLLAAARVQVMSPRAILEGVEARFKLLSTNRKSGPERHRSLHASIAWSFDLLRPELKVFLTQLTVFRGSFSHVDVEQVLENPLALDYLAELCDCSFLTTEISEHWVRFVLLETLRLFADQQWSAPERAELCRRHAKHFAALTLQAREHWRTDQEPLWMERLERELANLRQAMRWSLEQEDPERLEVAYQLGSSLGRFWWINVYLKEGQEFLLALLRRESLSKRITPEELIRLQISLISQLMMSGHYEDAKKWGLNALELAISQEDDSLESILCANISSIEMNLSNEERFTHYSLKAESLFVKNKDKKRLVTLYHNISLGYLKFDDLSNAVRYACKQIITARKLSFSDDINGMIVPIAGSLCIKGNREDALLLYRYVIKESLRSKRFFETIGALLCYYLIRYKYYSEDECLDKVNVIYGFKEILGFEEGIVSSKFIAQNKILLTPKAVTSAETTKKTILRWAEELTQDLDDLSTQELRKIVKEFVRNL